MVQGIRFRDGTVIDFQDTEWSIEVDTVSDEVVFEHAASGNTYTYGSSGEFSASELNFTDGDLTVQTLALGTTLVTDTDSPYTTSGEGVIFADSSSAPVEVVLASADRRDGLGVTVIDVGGAAGTNAITISTEGSETIDGGASSLIEAEYGAKRLASDGTDWFSAGGGSGAGGVPVEDDGSLVLDPAKNINFGNALSVSDDGDDTITVDGVQYTDEQAQDAINSLLTEGNAVSLNYDDVNDTLTIDVSESSISLANLTGDTDSVSEGASNLYFTDERAQDAVGTILGTLLSYDDAANAISVSIDDDEMLTFGTNDDISQFYDSANDEIRWRDETNSADRMALDRTTGDLSIEGELSEGSTL